VEIDTNQYSVPWRLIGATVTVEVSDGVVRIRHAGAEVARHEQIGGRRQRVLDVRHLEGIVGLSPDHRAPGAPGGAGSAPAAPELLRPLAEYEAVIGGGW
jgi:hypothetical protein